MRIASTSILEIDELPVTCGEPVRRTDNICTYRSTRARDEVWDMKSSGDSGSVVRFDLRDSFDVRDSGSGESSVKESGVVSGIGIESEHEFPSISGTQIEFEEFHEDRQSERSV